MTSIEGLHELTSDLGRLVDVTEFEVKKSVQQAGMDGRKAWQNDAKSSYGRWGRQFAASIDYEEGEFGKTGYGGFAVEIGPNLTRYGGKTGEGGLIPSLAFLDEANGGVTARPRGTRERFEPVAEKILAEKMDIAVAESLRKADL